MPSQFFFSIFSYRVMNKEKTFINFIKEKLQHTENFV